MSETDINTHVLLVLGAIERDGKFLLAKRSSKDPQAAGEWAFPGGKVDVEVGDHVIEETLRKELFEEVGVKIMDEVELLWNDAFVRVSGHHVVSLFFLCYYKSGEAKPLEDQEDVKWMTLKEIEQSPDTPSYTLKRVRALLAYKQRKGI